VKHVLGQPVNEYRVLTGILEWKVLLYNASADGSITIK
jgi:hypothetical protein